MTAADALMPVILVAAGAEQAVIVSEDATPAELVAGMGLDYSQLQLTTSTGVALDSQRSLREQVQAGAVLQAVTLDAPTTGLEDAHVTWRDLPRRRRFEAAARGWIACCVGLAACAVLAGLQALALSQGEPGLADPVRWSVGGVLALAALVFGVRTRPDADEPHRLREPGTPDDVRTHLMDETVLAPALAFAAGLLLSPPDLPGAGSAMVVVGGVAGAAAAVLRYAVSRSARDTSQRPAGMLAALWGLLAAVLALCFVASVPPQVGPILVAGAVPLMVRALPSIAVTVPPSQLLDLSVVQRTARSVRAQEPKPPGRVRWERVYRQVKIAETTRLTGLVTLCALTPIVMVPVLLSYRHGTLTGWATLALVACLLVCFGLGARTERGGIGKIAPRVTFSLILIEVAVAARLADQAPEAAMVVLLVAVIMVFTAMSVGRGFRSVRWSRIGDIAEAIAVALSLPAAIVAAGAIEALPLLTAG